MKSLLVIMLLAASMPAWAAEKAVSLDEVVITATRADEEIDKISSNVTVITQEEIKKSPATTVQDLLRSEDGIIIRDLYGTGTKSSVDMRGFVFGLNTVVLIDGRRINEIDLSGVDWNTIPLENIERIEVVRGSQSVLYGDNAMAGAINIITKKGFSGKPEFVVDGRIESYGGHSEHATFRGGNDQVNAFFFLKHRQTGGYRENSEFSATDLNTRINFKPNNVFSLDFAAGYHEDDQGLPGGLTENQVNQDRRQSLKPDDNVAYTQRYVDARANFALGTWGDLEFGYSFNNRKYDSTLIFFGSDFNSKRSTDTIGLKTKLTVDTRVAGLRNLLVAGIDHYDITADNTISFFGLTNSTITKKDTGIYLQDELFVTDKLSFSLGYRNADATFRSLSDEQTFREDAFKIGATYNYARHSKLFVNYSKGYRLPTTDEFIDFFTGAVANLKPEKSDTYEVGVVHSFAKTLQARLTLYQMNVKDELYFNPIAPPFGANENLEKTEHYGAEAGFTASPLDDLSVSGTFTYAEAKFKAGPFDGNHIHLVPRYSASIGADYRFQKAFLLALSAHWTGKKYLDGDFGNGLEKMKAYTVVNTRLSYTYKSLTAYAGINNIFGEKYSEYGNVVFGTTSFYPAPERNFYGGLRIAL